ncbi:DUF4251 domain-containing protein [Mangrovibacterium lignilyticum]|uniref:DUF4251 domain-containing protein n=1 Tax=Mangrovibacterium lignilyticum TaxID=2668052 RepID=UPI0013D184D0|nr:DUF4251 domain-containing protein [Mangrovibacterium lignilyticum]
MRYAVIMLLVLMLGFQTGFAQKLTRKERKEQKVAEVKELIDSGDYIFIARSANPMSGRKIDLTSTYELQFKGDSVHCYLPYFGRAYQAPYGGGEGGIKFDEVVDDVKTEYNDRKQSYDVRFEVKTEVDTYTLYLNVGLSGYGNLNVNSNNRQSISYYGVVEALPKKK